MVAVPRRQLEALDLPVVVASAATCSVEGIIGDLILNGIQVGCRQRPHCPGHRDDLGRPLDRNPEVNEGGGRDINSAEQKP